MRLRDQLVFFGAHTGRWAGRDLQPQNLPRKATDKEALKAMLEGSPVKSMEALSTLVRPCVRAPQGKKLLVSDLSAIENRVLAWLSGCDSMLEVYQKGLDPYKAFAVELFNVDYDDVTKEQRQESKVPVLACGFGQGPGQERVLVTGQKIRTGLWGYAEKLGIKLTVAQRYKMVYTFRSVYAEVPAFWTYLEDAFLAAYQTQKWQQVGYLYFTADRWSVKIKLPSGRFIHYLNPHAYRSGQGSAKITFDGYRKGGWGRVTAWGGVLCENVVQAVARDVLAEGMLRAEEAGVPIVMHVHDELVGEVRTDAVASQWFHNVPFTDNRPHKALEKWMSDPISWAPGLPLAAEGYEGEFYEKR